MTKYISNAFSLQMLKKFPVSVKVQEVGSHALADFKGMGAISVVGHQDTANVLGVSCNRQSVTLDNGDQLLVAQLQGGRLPEGATTLPDGFTFKFLLVTIGQ